MPSSPSRRRSRYQDEPPRHQRRSSLSRSPSPHGSRDRRDRYKDNGRPQQRENRRPGQQQQQQQQKRRPEGDRQQRQQYSWVVDRLRLKKKTRNNLNRKDPTMDFQENWLLKQILSMAWN
ncbi:unnamed protein product [Absidia cylindrospora]